MATAQTTLEIVLQAKDEASAKLNAFSGGANKLKGALAGVGGAIAGAFAVSKVVDFAKESVEAFAKAEASTARVNAALATMGEKGIQAKGAIEKMSQASIKLAFDDEDSAESITKLFQRTGDLTKAQELNATAMDLARAKNIDLDTATNLVLNTLSGKGGPALRQYGIDIKDSATPLEALGILHDKVRGQAEAFANTAQGKFEQLGIVTDNLKETFGGALFEGIKPFIDELTVWAQDPTVLEFMKSMGVIISTVLINTFKILKGTIDFLSDAFVKMFEVAGKVGDFFKKAFPEAINFLKEAMNNLIAPFQKVYDLLSGIVSKAVEAAKYVGGKVVGAVANVFGGKALGGTVMGGQPYIVGERGPELFTPMRTGSISPNGSLGGGITLVINMNGGTYLSDDVVQKIGDRMISQFKRTARI